MPFYCTICEEESTRICVSCTKDTCGNHLCDRCGSCSDCCSCEVLLDTRETSVASFVRHPEPAPHPYPLPEPDPEPEPEPFPGL